MSERIANHFSALLAAHGNSYLAGQHSSRDSQYRRFASLTRIANLSGKRVLDYGCGTGALAQYLVERGQVPSVYHGVDVVPEFFVTARQNYPDGVYSHPDNLEDAKFDVAILSGIFSNRRRDNRKFWKATVGSLFTRCDIGLAFNLMSTYVDYRDPGLFYESPEAALRFVKQHVTPYVALNHDYLAKEGSVPYEFTMFAYRNPVELEMP